MKAGFFTAQLGVTLTATAATIKITAGHRVFKIDRQHFVRLDDTSILGLFKRGIRFQHTQRGLASNVVFYPRIGQESLRRELGELGWS